jgi:S1-C subfamily serine protease
MDDLRSLSDSFAALASKAALKLFHVPSPLGGRSALGFDGSLLLVPAFDAREGESLEILAPGGEPVLAEVVGFDTGLGLAVLKLRESLASTAWTPASGLPALASLVLVAAYPSPQGAEARLDAVRFSGGEGDEAYIQTDGSRFPGFAGAALVDPEGALSGFLVSDSPGNRSWAIPGARAARLARSIAQRGFPGRAWLGISTLPVETPPGYAELFGDGRESALIVASLEAEGPAAKAGLLVGDLLVSIGGRPTPDPAGLRAALGEGRPGEKLHIVVLRAGEKVELDALPESRKDEDDRRGASQGDWRGCYGGPGRCHGHGWGWGWRRGR